MEWLWNKVKNFLKVFFSYVIAILRLIIWTIIFFFSGLQRTLFTRSEVLSLSFKLVPLRCDMEDTDEKLAYIDKLCFENPDLLGVMETEEMLDDEDIDIPFDDDGDSDMEN